MDQEIENPIEAAREQVEEAQENLERVETEVRIVDAEHAAQAAVQIALDVSNESQTAIENVQEELNQQEENDEWLRTQVHELMTLMGSLQDELSILKQSLQNPPAQDTVMETEKETISAPTETVEPEAIIMPETTTETSSETKTEVPNESGEGEPVLQTILNPRRKIRLI